MGKLVKLYSSAITIIVGIMFMAGGLLLFFTFDPDAYDMETTGTIVEITEEYDQINETWNYTPYIDFDAMGQKLTNVPYDTYKSSMKVGDEVVVYYKHGHPEEYVGEDKGFARIFGLIMAAVGFVVMFPGIFKKIKYDITHQ